MRTLRGFATCARNDMQIIKCYGNSGGSVGSSEISVGIKGGMVATIGGTIGGGLVGRMGGRVGSGTTVGAKEGMLMTVPIGSGGTDVFGSGVDGALVGVEPAAGVGVVRLRGVAVVVGVAEARPVTAASVPVGVGVGVAVPTLLGMPGAVAVGFNGKPVIWSATPDAAEASLMISYRMTSLMGGITMACKSRL